MRFVVKKSVYEELVKSLDKRLGNKIFYIILDSDNEINKAWNESEHPRTKSGRFTEKGVMELSEKEHEELLDYLESEKYVKYKNFYVSEKKIDSVNSGKYKNEVDACEKLGNMGFEVYLLRESYVKGSKADTMYKKDGDRDLLEIKHAHAHKIITRFNESKKQAPSVFISLMDDVPYNRYKDLKDAINKDDRNGFVVVEYKGKCKIIKNKQLNKIAPTEVQKSTMFDPFRFY